MFGADPFGFGAGSHAWRLTTKLDLPPAAGYVFMLGVNAAGRLSVNGTEVINVGTSTGQFQIATGSVDILTPSSTIEIVGFDNGNPEVQFSFALPDGAPTVASTATLTPTIVPYQATTIADGTFSIPAVPTTLGDIGAVATFVDAVGKRSVARAASVAPVPAGITDLGVLRASDGAVLVLADADTPGTAALASALRAAGHTVTVRPAPEFTWDGTNPPLAGFDVVIHLDGSTYSAPLPGTAQAALVAFVRNGGGFIGGQWNGYELGSQQGMTDLILQLWNTGNDQDCGQCIVTYNVEAAQASHPLLADIPPSFTFFADGHSAGQQVFYETGPSTVLMRIPAGGPAVLVRNLGNGRVVNFSIAPNYLSSQTLQDPNIQHLYANAVAWTIAR